MLTRTSPKFLAMAVVELCKKYALFCNTFCKNENIPQHFFTFIEKSITGTLYSYSDRLQNVSFVSNLVPRVLFDLDIEKNYSAKLCFSKLAP